MARKRKKKGPPKRTTSCICSSCGLRSELYPSDLFRSSRPRCPKCGGPVNRVRDEFSRPKPNHTVVKFVSRPSPGNTPYKLTDEQRVGGSGAALEPTVQRQSKSGPGSNPVAASSIPGEGREVVLVR